MINMFEVKGFIFKTTEKGTQKLPLGDGLLAHDYEEVHETMKALGIEHYMFLLREVKE